MILQSTKLQAEDRTQYTEADGEKEEEIKLGGRGANSEEGEEVRNRRKGKTNIEKRLKGYD